MHFGSALGLFLTLSYFSLCLFTKSSGHETPEKLLRNRIYRFCGWTILTSIVLIGLYYLLWQETVL